MPGEIRSLGWNEASLEELARHGLEPGDAAAVLASGLAKRFRQPARRRRDPFRAATIQPERIKLIGPDRSGRLLTFILELPDGDGRAHIVTGWIADTEERSRYRKPGGCRA